MEREVAEKIVESWALDNERLAMGSGGDRKHEEATDAQDLFPYRYWYTWKTAQEWPSASVVLCRWRAEGKWYYSLITYFQPNGRHIEGTEYLLIERDTLQGPDRGLHR